jgi:hypothetical protein
MGLNGVRLAEATTSPPRLADASSRQIANKSQFLRRIARFDLQRLSLDHQPQPT